LLNLAESNGFEIFVTMDKGLEYEQNLAGRSIAISDPSRQVKSVCGPPSLGA